MFHFTVCKDNANQVKCKIKTKRNRFFISHFQGEACLMKRQRKVPAKQKTNNFLFARLDVRTCLRRRKYKSYALSTPSAFTSKTCHGVSFFHLFRVLHLQNVNRKMSASEAKAE